MDVTLSVQNLPVTIPRNGCVFIGLFPGDATGDKKVGWMMLSIFYKC